MRVAARGEEELRAPDGAVQLVLVDLDARPAKKQSIVHCSVGSARSSARTQSRTVSRVMGAVLAEPRDERVPALLGAGRLEPVHEAAARVDQDERWLIRRAEPPRERALRILDRRPLPAVAAHEGASPIGRVRGVQPEEVEPLALLRDPACVGDRLAIAGASPGRPDVDDHRLPAQVAEREALAVERRPGDRRRRLRAPRPPSRPPRARAASTARARDPVARSSP